MKEYLKAVGVFATIAGLALAFVSTLLWIVANVGHVCK